MSVLKTVLGSMEIAGRVMLPETKLMLHLFQKYNGVEIDSAFMYEDGKSEEFLGRLKDKTSKINFEYATKANPLEGKTLGAKSVRVQLETSLKNLQTDSVSIFYLHMPDHHTPLKETLKAVDELHKEGKFNELGLSNYSSWLVSEVVNLCKQNNWIQPTVYQGMYSALTRMVEKELLPCVRYHNMRFYGFSPLGGGLLTGKHRIEDLHDNEPGRFFSGKRVDIYRNRYWKREYFDAVGTLSEAIYSSYGNSVSIAEAAIRWLYHHSALKGEYGDAVVIGASSVDNLSQNLLYTTKGPLDENVVSVIDNIWKRTSHLCPDYAR
ncbi:aflatoxin B1 aldehyde reductase member 2-like [Styela clava]